MIAAALALAGALAATAAGGGAPVALLIPVRAACLGGAALELGVVYTANPPGPRTFSLDVRGPHGRHVFHADGRATREWRFWRYRPTAAGTYETTYRLAWGTERFRTRVKRCRP